MTYERICKKRFNISSIITVLQFRYFFIFDTGLNTSNFRRYGEVLNKRSTDGNIPSVFFLTASQQDEEMILCIQYLWIILHNCFIIRNCSSRGPVVENDVKC